MEIGFSTGCLYRTNLNYQDKVRLYSSAGANAIELILADDNTLKDFKSRLSSEMIKRLKEYDFVSIHSSFDSSDDLSTNNRTLGGLRDLCARLPIKGIVLHPDTINYQDFLKLEKSGLPFLMENMDKGKKSGGTLEDIERIKNDFNFGFVFDTQHGYEQDHSMRLSNEILEVMGDRLKHMHVSGYSGGENHMPVHLSENILDINKILEKRISVPKICEGAFYNHINLSILEELSFIRSYESSE